MTLKFKLYLAFSVVVVLAASAALYGMQVVSRTSTQIVRLYDGPLMAVSQARSAQLHFAEALAAMNRSIEFQVDPDTRQIVVRLIDTQSNEVLRQIPSQEMLEIAKSIDHLQGVLLRNRA